MFTKWISGWVLLALSWHICPTGAFCRHPGHQQNEYVIFTHPLLQNNTFPTGTVAKYFCQNVNNVHGFKHLQCVENGAWTIAFTDRPSECCAPVIDYRCQQPSNPRIPLPSQAIVIGHTCINLYYGVYRDEHLLTAWKGTCDIHAYGTTDNKRRNKKHANSDAVWLNDFAKAWNTRRSYPQCPKVLCKETLFEYFNKLTYCDSSTIICKKAISSCGTPSRNPCSSLTLPSIFVGAKVEYQCDEGYDTSDNITRVCGFDGKWSGEAPKCNKIPSCGNLPKPVHTIMTISGINFKDRVWYKCETGYSTAEALTRVCGKDGQWSGKAPACKPIDCRNPNRNEDVTYQLINGTTTFGSWLNYSCSQEGYAINGSQYRICRADGQWDGEESICYSTYIVATTSSSFALYDGEEELLKTIIGVMAGVTVFLMVFMWLMLPVLLYRDKRKQQA